MTHFASFMLWLVCTIYSSYIITISIILTTAGEDYISGPFTAVIPAKMTSVSFSVKITSDNILEQDEDFILAIDRRSLPIQVTAIDPYEVTIVIMDDDEGKCIVYCLLDTDNV